MPKIEDYEEFCGITHYSTSTPSIGGKLKTVPSDFIVREITTNQEILSTKEIDQTHIPFNEGSDYYTSFHVIKTKMDTIIVSKILAAYLDISQADITWAGIKDNNAITVQQFSVRGNHFEALGKFKHKSITLCAFRGTRKRAELGKLWGNNFSINLREIIKPYAEIEDDLKTWEKEITEFGFPNYFDMQRFGKHRPNSHIVGKLLFQNDIKNAVNEFLFTPYPKEYEYTRKVRTEFGATFDYAGAAAGYPNSLHYEKGVLRSLVEYPNNMKAALMRLPIPLLNLIMSSYQSYLFNRAISKRLDQGNTLSKPIPGDIIAILKEKYGPPSLVFYKYSDWNEDAIKKAFNHNRASIVAPIVGFETKLHAFPTFKKIYEDLLLEENMSVKSFKHKHYKLFRFEGTFRPIYNRATKLRTKQAHITNKYPDLDDRGVQLDFSLPKGTYATLVLRELQKKGLIKHV